MTNNSTFSIEAIRDYIQHMTTHNHILVCDRNAGEPTRYFAVDRNHNVVAVLTEDFGKCVHQLAAIEAEWIIKRR